MTVSRTQRFVFIFFLFCSSQNLIAQSVAQTWMKTALKMVTLDGQGPTIQSRNLFHLSAVMYDTWAYYDPTAKPYLMGNTIGDFSTSADYNFKIPVTEQTDSLREVAINHAARNFLFNRFNLYGSKGRTMDILDSTFIALGYEKNTSIAGDMHTDPISLANHVVNTYQAYGFQDGSKEEDGYESYFYQTANPQMDPSKRGSQQLRDKNRWQPLNLMPYIKERNGDVTLDEWNFILATTQGDFLSPEWGEVTPFSFTEKDLELKTSEVGEFKLYVDPKAPPFIEEKRDSENMNPYKWGFVMVALWSAHLDTEDSVYIDISPNTMGDIGSFPESYDDYPTYFNLLDGGAKTKGYEVNPYTKQPYDSNIVLLGDYTRVLAEYWVDGINTAGPPGHWFKNLIDVTNHPQFEQKWNGTGYTLKDLDWDVKSYFTLGGALLDAGIAAWGAKGYYDYIRPISAIRYMAGKGQCTDSTQANYHVDGLPLIPNRIETIKENDALAGDDKSNVGKMKIWCWRGPDYVSNPYTTMAGVGWILAEDWWPYQRYSFATPPFAGYVSGHSTFSIAAADVLTSITGSPYFPGGLFETTLKKNKFLIFEDGPTQEITLQWATYRDAANETCLSRIWGGIHPPCDDIKGRIMGAKIAKMAVSKAETYFK
jgi:hypothetical protein